MNSPRMIQRCFTLADYTGNPTSYRLPAFSWAAFTLCDSALFDLGFPQDGCVVGTPTFEVYRDEFSQRTDTHLRAAKRAGEFACNTLFFQAFHDVQFGVVFARTQIGKSLIDAREALGTLHLRHEFFDGLPVVLIDHGQDPCTSCPVASVLGASICRLG